MNDKTSTSSKSLAIAPAITGLLDAFVFGQGVIVGLPALIFFTWGVAGFIYLSGKEAKLLRLRIGLTWLVAGVLSIGCIALNNQIARHRAEKLVVAVKAYKARTGHYPQRLEDLVPSYAPKVPISKYTLTFNYFMYIHLDGKPSLMYTAIPPFGRPYFSFERDTWGRLD